MELHGPAAVDLAPIDVAPRAPVEAESVFAAAQRGDPDAFATVFSRYAPVVHGIALARLGPSDADDVVQETFLTLHRSIATIRDGSALGPWLRAVATNAAIDRLRRRLRRRGQKPLPDCEAKPLPTEDTELRRHVLARIQGLPEAYRETLVWRLVEGLSGPEIAERTGLTAGSVRINLHRGMAILRMLLEKDGWRRTP